MPHAPPLQYPYPIPSVDPSYGMIQPYDTGIIVTVILTNRGRVRVVINMYPGTAE